MLPGAMACKGSGKGDVDMGGDFKDCLARMHLQVLCRCSLRSS